MPQRYRNVNKRLNDILSTSQNKSYFVGAVTVVFIVIMAMVGILPAYSAFTFQNEENGKRDIVIQKLGAKLATSQTLSKEYDAKTDLINYFNKVFPATADQQGIITLINTIVTTNNSFLSKIGFNKNPSTAFTQLGYDEQIKSQQVNVTATGSRSALLNIVKDIEGSRRILNIASFTLDKIPQESLDTQTESHGDYVLTVQLDYYFYSPATSTTN